MAARVNVLGASGSGASTVGRAVAQMLATPHFDCDDYYHAPTDPPFQRPRPAAERARLMQRDLPPEKDWVLSGGVAGWDPCPQLNLTCTVFLYTATSIRIDRLKRREQTRFGQRILAGGDMHQQHREFLEWASRYDAGDVPGKTLARHLAYLRCLTHPVLYLSGGAPVRRLTRQILRFLDAPGPCRDEP